MIARVGNILPYSGYSTSNTLINALRPFPQFSTIGVLIRRPAKPGTLAANEIHQAALPWPPGERHFYLVQVACRNQTGPFVQSTKSLETTDQPFLFNTNIVYTTQTYFANRLAAVVTKDWAFGAFLQYGSGLPLTPPTATNTNYIGGSEMFRVPGQPLYLKSLNCGCINAYTDVVLNPNAWANPVNGAFGPALGTLYGDFRQAHRPQENFNIARTFRLHEGVSLQIRAEFVNIFNRTQIGNPSTSAPGSAPSRNIYGQYSAGFGVVNLTVAGAQQAPGATLNAVVGQLYQPPRSGTLIARITF